MVSQEQVREIVQSLPETGEEENYFSFFVMNKSKKKSIAWVWLERETPKKREFQTRKCWQFEC